MSNIIKHSFGANIPTAAELSLGEIALWVQSGKARLFTKTLTNEVLEISPSVEYLSQLLDVDLTAAKEGSYLVKQGDKFVASNVVGNIGDLTNVELIGTVADRQYLRYDSLYEAFINVYPSYNLHELSDVDVALPTNDAASLSQENQSLYYEHSSGTFKTRDRRNLLDQLDDVNIVPEEFPSNKLLVENSLGIWSPQTLDISNDTTPDLGGNLDCNNYFVLNQGYAVNYIDVSLPIHQVNYDLGDYWIVNGVSSSTVSSTVININATPLLDSAFVLMLEIRQNTGQILIGGLTNVRYEDGKPILLSGNGKTDLISILVTNETGIGITSTVTSSALNLAASGAGGTVAERYSGSGGGAGGSGSAQVFTEGSLYDDYYEYVQLLLNFEDEVATGKAWNLDKSTSNHPCTTTATQASTNYLTFGIREYVANFPTLSSEIVVNPVVPILMEGDFTLEFYVNYANNALFAGVSTVLHRYFDSTNLRVQYRLTAGYADFEVVLLGSTYLFSNAVRSFRNQNNRYVHVALVRSGNTLSLFVDGYVYDCNIDLSPISTADVSISNATINLQGNLNSVRLTSIARYPVSAVEFAVPNMRFGLTGGAEELMEDYIFNTSHYLGEMEIEHEMFDIC